MGQNAKDKAAGEASRQQSLLASQLWGELKGPLQEVLGIAGSGVGEGYNNIPGVVKQEFADANRDMNLSYDNAIKANRELATARARSGTAPYTTGELDAAIAGGTRALNDSRAMAARNLQFQQAQAGMQQYNSYLNLLGMGANTALGMGNAWAGNQIGAIGQMQQGGGWGGALSGAVSGAAAGTSVYPGWGTVIGGVLGGVAGGMG